MESKITFSTQLPEGPEDLVNIFKGKPGLLVIDDYQNESLDDLGVANLFTKHSHHCDVTCIFIGQSMFPKGKYARTMSTNSHYYLCFYNERDEVTIKTLLQQAFAENYRYICHRVVSGYHGRTVQIHATQSTPKDTPRAGEEEEEEECRERKSRGINIARLIRFCFSQGKAVTRYKLDRQNFYPIPITTSIKTMIMIPADDMAHHPRKSNRAR